MADLRVVVRDLHRCAFLFTGSRAEAPELVSAVVRSAARARSGARFSTLIAAMARTVAKEQRRTTTFSILDDDLRQRPKITVAIAAIESLAWEAKRTCFARVLGCLSGSLRVAFVLTDVLGFDPAQAAAMLEIEEGAYRVRLARARRNVEGFLAPRCAHYARSNPCSCSEVGPAWLELGVFDCPPGHDTPRRAHDEDPPIPQASLLYRRLPAPELGPHELIGLAEALRGADE